MRNWLIVVLMLLLISVPAMAQENESAYVRATHFSVDAPEVDIYLNGELAFEALDFPDVSDWIELDEGIYRVAVVATGAAIEDAVLDGEYSLSSGDWTTLAVIGEVTRDTLAIQPLVDDLSNIEEGLTYVSAFHGITDLDPVNVFVGDIELVRTLSYPGVVAESDGYAGDAITPGDYDFDVQDAGGNSLLTLSTTTLGVGRAYFLAAVGTAANPVIVFVPTDVESMMAGDVDPLADVETGSGSLLARIGHFSVDAPEVDIYINGDMVLETAQFGDLSDYMEFNAGIYDVALVPTGEALENAIYEGQIALVADSVTLVAAVGFAEDESLEVVIATEDNQAPAVGFSRIAFFQAIPSVELFNLNMDGSILIQGVTFPIIFDNDLDGYVSFDVVADVHEFEIMGAGTSINVGNITTGSGRIYLIIAAGTESSPVYFLISGDFPADE